MTILIITLPGEFPDPAIHCQGVLSSDGRTGLQPVDAPLALLPWGTVTELVAVVPAGRLSWHRLALPRGALRPGRRRDGHASRLRSVLDGLLEDRLLDDTAQLHFAIEPQPRADQPVWVAACDRAWLHAWLAALAQAGRPAARIVPELVPAADDAAGEGIGQAALHISGTPEQAWMTLAGPHGVVALPLSVAAASLAGWPDGAPLLAEPGVVALTEHFFNRPSQVQTAPERWLAATQNGWDLAQFDLLHTRGTRARKRLSTLVLSLLHAPQWRPARWSVLALVVANLVGLQAWAWHEQAALAQQQAAIRSVLTATFPDVRVVVDAPLQMSRALADLQRRNGTASAADLETLLVRVKAHAPDLPTPGSIDFAAGELRLKGLDPALPALASLLPVLKEQGYSARLEEDGLTVRQQPERLP